MKKTALIFTLCLAVIVVLAGAFRVYNNRRGGVDTGSNVNTTRESNQTGSPIPTAMEESTKKVALTLDSPTDGQTVTSPTLTISGITSPLAEVFVNDTETKADSKGRFSTRVTLDEGENIIVVTVNDQEGNFVEKEITVTYNSSS